MHENTPKVSGFRGVFGIGSKHVDHLPRRNRKIGGTGKVGKDPKNVDFGKPYFSEIFLFYRLSEAMYSSGD